MVGRGRTDSQDGGSVVNDVIWRRGGRVGDIKGIGAFDESRNNRVSFVPTIVDPSPSFCSDRGSSFRLFLQWHEIRT
jgi:hypothetical protein